MNYIDKIENFIELCKKINSVVYSNSFYPISQLKNLKDKEINFIFKSLNKDAEKKIIAFSPKDYPEEYIEFPIKFFKIKKKSKFISLEHKHYLGSILNLGIKREILGDLLVKDEQCYGIIIESMFDFLKENLIKINSSPVEVEEIDENEIPQAEFKDMNVSLASLRLDNIVSELTNLSRNSASEYIDLGNVQVNYEIEREKNYKLKVGDIIIIRKFGKFILSENRGMSKKDKIRLLIKKYI